MDRTLIMKNKTVFIIYWGMSDDTETVLVTYIYDSQVILELLGIGLW